MATSEREINFQKAEKYQKIGLLEKSAVYYKRCLQDLEEDTEFSNIPRCLRSLAIFYWNKGKVKKSLNFLEAEELYYSNILKEIKIIQNKLSKNSKNSNLFNKKELDGKSQDENFIEDSSIFETTYYFLSTDQYENKLSKGFYDKRARSDGSVNVSTNLNITQRKEINDFLKGEKTIEKSYLNAYSQTLPRVESGDINGQISDETLKYQNKDYNGGSEFFTAKPFENEFENVNLGSDQSIEFTVLDPDSSNMISERKDSLVYPFKQNLNPILDSLKSTLKNHSRKILFFIIFILLISLIGLFFIFLRNNRCVIANYFQIPHDCGTFGRPFCRNTQKQVFSTMNLRVLSRIK